MPASSISATDARRAGGRIVALGIAAIVALLVLAGGLLMLTLPDGNAFNARVERIFVEHDLTAQAEVKLLEILALSGTAFADTLASYRMVIFVLLVFAAAMLVAALVFLVMLAGMNRRMAQIEHLSPSPCLMRVKKLQQAGYITGYSAQIDVPKLGETLTVFTEFTLKNHRQIDFARFQQALEQIDSCVECHLVSGGYDYLAKFVTSSISDYQNIIEAQIGRASCRERC